MKIKFGVDISFGVKVWDILFYLPREFDVGASKVFPIYLGSLMQEHLWFLNSPTLFYLWLLSSKVYQVAAVSEGMSSVSINQVQVPTDLVFESHCDSFDQVPLLTNLVGRQC